MTIHTILESLSPNDNRKEFWERMLDHLGNYRWKLAMELLHSHSMDSDYTKQCEAVLLWFANLTSLSVDVVGLSMTGGVWLSGENCGFADRKAALQEVDKDRANKIPSQVFNIRIKMPQ